MWVADRMWTDMTYCRSLILLVLGIAQVVVAGCASHRAPTSSAPGSRAVVREAPGPSAGGIPTTGKEGLTLDQIEPGPVLAPVATSTRPAGPAPVEAVRLFAQ